MKEIQSKKMALALMIAASLVTSGVARAQTLSNATAKAGIIMQDVPKIVRELVLVEENTNNNEVIGLFMTTNRVAIADYKHEPKDLSVWIAYYPTEQEAIYGMEQNLKRRKTYPPIVKEWDGLKVHKWPNSASLVFQEGNYVVSFSPTRKGMDDIVERMVPVIRRKLKQTL